jgi:hypothetical protein
MNGDPFECTVRSWMSHPVCSLLQENGVTKPCELFYKVGKQAEKCIFKLV